MCVSQSLTIAAATVVARIQTGDDRAVKQTQETIVLLGADIGVGRVRVAARALAVRALSVQLLSGVANLGASLGEGQNGGGKEGSDSAELHYDGWFGRLVRQTWRRW